MLDAIENFWIIFKKESNVSGGDSLGQSSIVLGGIT